MPQSEPGWMFQFVGGPLDGELRAVQSDQLGFRVMIPHSDGTYDQYELRGSYKAAWVGQFVATCGCSDCQGEELP